MAIQKYHIYRFTQGAPRTLVKANVTEAEAQAHCNRADTRGDGWFDGYAEAAPLNYFGNPYTKRAGLLEAAIHCLVYDRGGRVRIG